VKRNPRISARNSVDDSGDEAGGERRDAPDGQFARRGIRKKFDILHGLSQFVEHGNAAFEQRTSVFGRSNALPVTVEDAHAKHVFQIRN
jgi:hypothetical protein